MVFRGDLQLNEIKQIKIQDPSTNRESKGSKTNNESKTSLIQLTKEKIIDLFRDVDSFKNIEFEKIVSAELFIKFKKPKDLSNEDYQKILGAYLKPISDTENVIFVPKKGSPIKSSEILEVKTVNVDLTESKRISEKQLFQEMEKYLSEIILKK